MYRVLKFAAVALMAGVAAGQQPAPTPQQGQPPIRTIRPSPGGHAQIQPTRRVPPQQANMPVQQPAQPVAQPAPPPQQPPATATQQPPATPAPAAAPTPVSLQPIRPSEMPPVPPQVTYRDGLLTVQAVNSTLGSLLQTIRNKTGIQFEGAENAGERVAVSIGPAPEGEVLASIFNGSGFDYVAIAREDNPNIVQRVIMTPKARGAGVAAAFNTVQPQTPAQAEPDEEIPDEQVDNEPQDTPAQPPPVAPQQTQQQQQQQPQAQPQGTPKTPEQLLEELKQMQQQQQGGQQPPPNQAPKKPQ